MNNKSDKRTQRNLHLHQAIMLRLELMGLKRAIASTEALRRMQDANFKFDDWADYFSTVEREGFSLPHR